MYAKRANKSGTIWYMHEQPLHFTVLLSLKLKNYRGIPLLGGQGEYSFLKGIQNNPWGGADGKNN